MKHSLHFQGYLKNNCVVTF